MRVLGGKNSQRIQQFHFNHSPHTPPPHNGGLPHLEHVQFLWNKRNDLYHLAQRTPRVKFPTKRKVTGLIHMQTKFTLTPIQQTKSHKFIIIMLVCNFLLILPLKTKLFITTDPLPLYGSVYLININMLFMSYSKLNSAYFLCPL